MPPSVHKHSSVAACAPELRRFGSQQINDTRSTHVKTRQVRRFGTGVRVPSNKEKIKLYIVLSSLQFNDVRLLWRYSGTVAGSTARAGKVLQGLQP